MVGGSGSTEPDFPLDRLAEARTVADVAGLLRQLRRREARARRGAALTYRELADQTGWSHSTIGAYFAGTSLPPTDRFDALLILLGATAAESGRLATVRDRVDEHRRGALTGPDPAGSVGGPGGRDARPGIPAQLLSDVAGFTGREVELARLDGLLEGVDGDRSVAGSRAVTIAAVSGAAGVGKTALTLHWAHRVRARFPDGQLYVDLRGYGPHRPMPAVDALTGFLRALGVPPSAIPVDVEEQAARYRTETAGRRLLIVLDNAVAADQVRPLLPGTGTSLVLVTSRDTLAGLIARHGAHRIEVGLLPEPDAVTLLTTLIGDPAVGDRATIGVLAAQCARLPLALRIVAELAITRGPPDLGDLVVELADERRRLDLLDAGGDPSTAVRAVFSWSYQQLPTAAARLFRLIGLHPGPELTVRAAAALAGETLEHARRGLEELTRTHLVQRVAPDRYGTHDLTHAYAAQMAGEIDVEPDRRAALDRLAAYYLGATAAAMDVLHPGERHRRPHVPPAGTPLPPFPGPAAAQAWLDAERATLVAATEHLDLDGATGFVPQLARILFRYFDAGGYYGEVLVVSGRALAVARRTGDLAAQAYALANFGVVYSRRGRLADAAAHLEEARDLSDRLDDPALTARVLGNLGVVYSIQERLDQAADHHRRAREVFRRLGDLTSEARALGNLGVIFRRQGRLDEAVDHQRQSLALFRRLGDRVGEAEVLNVLGDSLLLAGRPTAARAEHTEALRVSTDLGYRNEEALAHAGIAAAFRVEGERGAARRHWRRALELLVELDLPEADGVRRELAALEAPETGGIRSPAGHG